MNDDIDMFFNAQGNFVHVIFIKKRWKKIFMFNCIFLSILGSKASHREAKEQEVIK